MDGEGCLVIFICIIFGIICFFAGLNFGNPGELVATKPQCEIAVNQERCVDTLFYVTKPYTRKETR